MALLHDPVIASEQSERGNLFNGLLHSRVARVRNDDFVRKTIYATTQYLRNYFN